MFSDRIVAVKNAVIEKCRADFEAVDAVAEANTLKVLTAFRQAQLGDHHFRTTSGYAYNDGGREKLEEVWARIFGAYQALVRTQFVSGTHALATVLLGILRSGDELVSITGAPYDTMKTVIGYAADAPASLKEYGVLYNEVPMINGRLDYDAIKAAINVKTKMVLIQRSRGYSMREPLSIEDIAAACDFVHSVKPDCICFVDNCYGEFIAEQEPTAVGADIIAGSLIKNPGGGIAPTGGYIAGRADLVELCSYRLTAPGIGGEMGASLVDNRLLFQGLFLAPHVVAQAVKSSIFAAAFWEELGYVTSPRFGGRRCDIIQAVQLNDRAKMLAFCEGLQRYSPVDSHVAPIPWAMPGYQDEIIMAAGTFVQGASIELSADGPVKEPYTVYLQGGLTFEHAVIGMMGAAQAIEELAQ